MQFQNKPWEEIDLQEEGWLNKFDLVFASMTPGVNDNGQIPKLLKKQFNSLGIGYLTI